MKYILIIIILLTSCGTPKEDITHKLFTIRMEKTTGSWVTKSYYLPEDANLFVWTQRGSYKLKYDSKLVRGCGNITICVKTGIVDFEIFNIKDTVR